MTYVSPETMNAIMRLDPDGGCVEPTPEAYEAFERHVRQQYGDAAWDAYHVPGWNDRQEGDWSHHHDEY
jgi:hypothetical protein